MLETGGVCAPPGNGTVKVLPVWASGRAGDQPAGSVTLRAPAAMPLTVHTIWPGADGYFLRTSARRDAERRLRTGIVDGQHARCGSVAVLRHRVAETRCLHARAGGLHNLGAARLLGHRALRLRRLGLGHQDGSERPVVMHAQDCCVSANGVPLAC